MVELMDDDDDEEGGHMCFVNCCHGSAELENINIRRYELPDAGGWSWRESETTTHLPPHFTIIFCPKQSSKTKSRLTK